MYRVCCALNAELFERFNLLEYHKFHDHDWEIRLVGGGVVLILDEVLHIENLDNAYYEIKWCNYQYVALYRRRLDGDFDIAAVTPVNFISVLFKALDPEEDYIFVGGRDLRDFPQVYPHV